MRQKREHSRGNTVIEFTLIGIPLIFVLISVFEMCRGMWLYHTLASAVREGTRFAAVHGNDCNLPPNSCAVTIRDVATRVKNSATGFVPSEIENLTFTSGTRTVACATLADCIKPGAPGDTYWPAGTPGTPIDVGANRRAPVAISASFRFRSAIVMSWPGAGRGRQFAAVVLPGSSRESIQY